MHLSVTHLLTAANPAGRTGFVPISLQVPHGMVEQRADRFGVSVQQTHRQRDFLKFTSRRRQRSKAAGCLYFSSFPSTMVSVLFLFSSRPVKHLATLRTPIDPFTSLSLLGWHRPRRVLQYPSWPAHVGWNILAHLLGRCPLLQCHRDAGVRQGISHPGRFIYLMVPAQHLFYSHPQQRSLLLLMSPSYLIYLFSGWTQSC